MYEFLCYEMRPTRNVFELIAAINKVAAATHEWEVCGTYPTPCDQRWSHFAALALTIVRVNFSILAQMWAIFSIAHASPFLSNPTLTTQ